MGQNLGRIFHHDRMAIAYFFPINLEQPVFFCMKPVKTHLVMDP